MTAFKDIRSPRYLYDVFEEGKKDGQYSLSNLKDLNMSFFNSDQIEIFYNPVYDYGKKKKRVDYILIHLEKFFLNEKEK